MKILKTRESRDEEKCVAKLRGIEKEANQREYDLDIKPYKNIITEDISAATHPDYKISREAVNKITEDMKDLYNVDVVRDTDNIEIYKNGQIVDRIPISRHLTPQEIQKRNIEGSYIYGRPGTDIFSIIPPHLQP